MRSASAGAEASTRSARAAKRASAVRNAAARTPFWAAMSSTQW